jgi:hypothetical protein
MRLLLILLCVICTSFSSYGQWYEAQGQAYITNEDNDSARAAAMENALKRALLVAGASVSSVQQVINGVLTQDLISIRASGTVNSFDLIEETYDGNLLTVKIRADIFPQEKQCFSEDYRKSILLTRSNILYREQANIGEIYNIDSELVKKMGSKINKDGHYLDAKLTVKNKNSFTRLNQSMQYDKVKSLVMSLSAHTNTQFVMFSEIEDLSLTNRTNTRLKFWKSDTFDRNFSMNLYIYDGDNGELVFDKQYHQTAPWAFKKRELVDTRSDTFWQSEYGNAISNTLDTMITDIDENMMCQPTRGKILQVNGDTILFNLGENHGVKVGDEFSLMHHHNFTADSGKTYAGFNVSEFKVKVTSTTRDSATATTPDNNLLGNIQINDIAVRY